ncbi:MAG: transglycosylase SLT domain-containing protein [Muribaculaceae bacterium]|nr:transglycosylase SLT domain-containing protein [Muribaculaceae bacterium]
MKQAFKYLVTITVLLLSIAGCTNKKSENTATTPTKALPDTIKVGTLYGPTSYFIYKGEEMGYEYELTQQFAKDKGKAVKITVAQNMESLISMLNAGRIDLIAYEIPITNEYKTKLRHCGKETITHQVLVQRKNTEKTIIQDVTELVGKDVYVEKNSKYESRLNNLNNEVGGGIKIHSIMQDTLITEDLIEMVSGGEIPLTIVDSDIARLNRTYYDNIDISLQVSFPQRASWAVSKKQIWLGDTINKWFKEAKNEASSKALLKRYFENSKNNNEKNQDYILDIKGGKISAYDRLFKHYSISIGWDWRLLAAQAYTESQFNPTAESWAGAKGLMQLMPRTAYAYGLEADELDNAEQSIKAATAYIRDLDRQLSPYIYDDKERIIFIIAAYNSGLGHVIDAIELAKKYGKISDKWNDNVEQTILLKSNPEYFNDEVCKYGYFKGKQTVEYVAKVEKIYDLYRIKVNRD